MIELSSKRFAVLGLQGSGKSQLCKRLLRGQPQHLVYDPLSEYKGFNRYQPQDRHSSGELDDFVTKAVIPWKPRLFVVDEASRYICPKPSPLPQGIAELNDWSRHYDIAWGVVCRRPSQLHSDIAELAHYLFIFRLSGRLDHHVLDSICAGLGQTVSTLQPYHFAVVEGGLGYYVHKPISIVDT